MFSLTNLTFLQLARKRHVGNDVVVIVFNEASKPYLSSLIASQFIHVLIVVAKEYDEDKHPFYSVAVTAKEDVPTFEPAVPMSGRFYSAEALRSFLLQKSLYFPCRRWDVQLQI